MKKQNKKKIYVVVTQTGTILSRILKCITHNKYNHASIALDENLNEMYSFGRKQAYNPFWGGFVRESPKFGTFKRFKKTISKIIEFEIDEEKYNYIKEKLHSMNENNSQYHYNYKGLFVAWFGKKLTRKNYYYCSEFVREIVLDGDVVPDDFFGNITQPIDFLKIPNSKIIYTGILKDFAKC